MRSPHGTPFFKANKINNKQIINNHNNQGEMRARKTMLRNLSTILPHSLVI